MSPLERDLTGPGVELVETHISWVFVGPDDVLKVKKPVDFGFLDFTTAERRRVACEAEVRLNSRLSPDVYRGVVPITLDDTGRHLAGGAGPVVDYAVHMNRLPESARADVLLAAGRLGSPEIDRIAGKVARFHDEVGASSAAARFGSPEIILANVRENFEQARSAIEALLPPDEATEIERRQTAFVETNRSLLERRIEGGRVRDGHGDLRLEHVYLEGDREPTIVDCIEFNDRFRFADVCADIAFLSMDLEQAGRSDLAERLLASYAATSGDYELYRLVDFYEGYRAYVRGKVASMLAVDRGAALDVRERARASARRYFLLALAENRAALVRPAVIAVGGVIGSGKSTVAERIAVMTSAPVISADRTRKQLAGVSAVEPLTHAAFAGAYDPRFTERVYEEVLARADHVLSSGRTAVIDASFRARAHREAARELARRHGVPFHFVECHAEIDVYRRRLEERARSPSISDGRPELLDGFVASFEPVTEIAASEHLRVQTSLPLEENAERLRQVLPVWPEGFHG